MEQLIEDLLMLARQGSVIGETEPVQLGELLSRCWSNVEAEGADLTVRVTGTIRADESRLASVVENLLQNAVEHGGETVRITVGRLEGNDGFYLEDDGPGVPAERRDRIFESGHSTSADGTGLGLAIVERIVDAHGWRIDVTEGATGGTRFEITGVEFIE
jgi:signal transduction histidine kinase